MGRKRLEDLIMNWVWEFNSVGGNGYGWELEQNILLLNPHGVVGETKNSKIQNDTACGSLEGKIGYQVAIWTDENKTPRRPHHELGLGIQFSWRKWYGWELEQNILLLNPHGLVTKKIQFYLQ